MVELLLTFGVGVIASIVSGIAGGGGGLISAPFFIFMGLPPQIAVATTKFGALGLTAGSIAKFGKTSHMRKGYAWYLSALSICAAVLGSYVLLLSSNEMVERLVGFTMLAAIPFIFIKDIGITRTRPGSGKQVMGYVAYFVILVLQAAFGAGIGMMLMVVMMNFLGFTALESNATRRIPGFLLAAVSLLIYIASGVVYYSYGIAMLGGMLVGGYIGTHIAIAKGDRFVKTAFAVIVAIFGLVLIMQ